MCHGSRKFFQKSRQMLTFSNSELIEISHIVIQLTRLCMAPTAQDLNSAAYGRYFVKPKSSAIAAAYFLRYVSTSFAHSIFLPILCKIALCQLNRRQFVSRLKFFRFGLICLTWVWCILYIAYGRLQPGFLSTI